MGGKEAEQKIPGVTLYHRGAKRYQIAGKNKAEMVVECTIDDEEVWVAVERMFHGGFRIYTQEDFQGEILNAFKEEVKQLEGQVGAERYERQRLEREISLLREELQQKTGALDAFNRQFGGL